MTNPAAAVSDPIAGLSSALDAVGRLVSGIREQQWSTLTVCSDWSVKELLNHVVGGNRMFAAVLTDHNPSDTGADHLDSDPVAAYRASAAVVRAAFTRPGALEKVVTVPFGTVPGSVALHLRTTEILVHGWDLARATAQSSAGLPAQVAGEELEFSRGKLDAIPPGQSPFAPPQAVPDDAASIDRLASLLGRPVAGSTANR